MELRQLEIDEEGIIKSLEGNVLNLNPVGAPFLVRDGTHADFTERVERRLQQRRPVLEEGFYYGYVKGNDYSNFVCAVQLYEIL